MDLPAVCDAHEGHAHNYDHRMLVLRGRLKVLFRYEQDGQVIEGETKEYRAFESLTVKAGVHHTITALEDDTLYECQFSHRDKDGIVVERYSAQCVQEAYH